MSVWLCIPSAREDGGTVPKWVEKGYRVALWRDMGAPPIANVLNLNGDYDGYPKAVNALIRYVCKHHSNTADRPEWFIAAGDDMLPDPNATPDIVALQCKEHFGGTLGVMQPTGDRWMVDDTGKAAAERICGSPWLGREYCQRANEGVGPYCERYYHFFCDEELQNVASRDGLLWQRRDLTHYHNHWLRQNQPRPKFLGAARMNWDKAKALFNTRRSQGFPGSELLAV